MASDAVWTDAGAGIRVRRSKVYAMNSALLLDAAHAVVIDPGVLPSELDDLAGAVAGVQPAKVTVFVTHGHWDHVIGLPWWPDAEVIAHDRVPAETRADAARILDEITKAAAEHGETWSRGFQPVRSKHAVSGLHYTTRGPWHLVFRDAPGHSDSQLTLHLPDRRVLFAADMLSDIEVPWLGGPPTRYRATLDALRPLAEHGAIETLVPGHGSVARGKEAVLERIERDLRYLEAMSRRPLAANVDLSPWGGGALNAKIHAENVGGVERGAP